MSLWTVVFLLWWMALGWFISLMDRFVRRRISSLQVQAEEEVLYQRTLRESTRRDQPRPVITQAYTRIPHVVRGQL